VGTALLLAQGSCSNVADTNPDYWLGLGIALSPSTWY
jgi:hypothetical protein